MIMLPCSTKIAKSCFANVLTDSFDDDNVGSPVALRGGVDLLDNVIDHETTLHALLIHGYSLPFAMLIM